MVINLKEPDSVAVIAANYSALRKTCNLQKPVGFSGQIQLTHFFREICQVTKPFEPLG